MHVCMLRLCGVWAPALSSGEEVSDSMSEPYSGSAKSSACRRGERSRARGCCNTRDKRVNMAFSFKVRACGAGGRGCGPSERPARCTRDAENELPHAGRSLLCTLAEGACVHACVDGIRTMIRLAGAARHVSGRAQEGGRECHIDRDREPAPDVVSFPTLPAGVRGQYSPSKSK